MTSVNGSASFNPSLAFWNALGSYQPQPQNLSQLQQLGAWCAPDAMMRGQSPFALAMPFMVQQTTIGYAAMPDFANSGRLDVDKAKGVVTTPGGFNVSVADGRVRIQNPDGKWTDLKAEPPERTLTSTRTSKETRQQATVERQLPNDPVVRESDGDVWRYAGAGTFLLPDGTQIRIQEQGTTSDLHINRVDIYNGNKHVGIDSKLTGHSYETYQRSERQTGATNWETTGSTRQWQGRALVRTDTQQRDVTTEVTEQQRARQTFQTTFSDVTHDGFAHQQSVPVGQLYRLAGKDGQIAWSQGGREVLSGAGRGKDDKTKEFKLGDAIPDSWQGYRPLEVPWNVYAFSMQNTISGWFQQQLQATPQHWGALQNAYGNAGPFAQNITINNFGNFPSLFAGPAGGASLFQGGFQGYDSSIFAMQSSVTQLFSVYQGLGSMQGDMLSRRFSMLQC